MILKQLTASLDFFYPRNLAEEWDNVGLLLGDERKEITHVLTALEITMDVVNEAIERNCELIVCHHPIIFKPLKNLNYNNPINKILMELIKHDIAVYCMHTNVDIAANGMNDWLCEILQVRNSKILQPTIAKNYLKVEIEVSPSKVDQLINNLKNAGVGCIGTKLIDYNLYDVEKTVEKVTGEMEKTDIKVIQSFIKDEDVPTLKTILYKNRIKIYRLTKIDNMANTYGIGRVGEIKPMSLEQLANKIKILYNIDHVSIVGSRETVINKVAIVGGSGANYVEIAKRKRCDVLITGDVGFHQAQEALSKGICLIDAGHAIEIIFNDYMADFINLFDNVVALSSEIDTNPFEVI